MAAVQSILIYCKTLISLERNFANSTSLGTLDNGKEFSTAIDNMKSFIFKITSLTETTGLDSEVYFQEQASELWTFTATP